MIHATDLSAVGSAALGLVQRRFPVHPLRPGTKRPATSHGFKDATLDPEQIRRWWTYNPDYGIGIATGHGFWVLDEDEPGATDGLELPETLAARTPSGGRHFYFLGSDVKCTARRIPGCDTKGWGGYVVAPPTPGYEWLADFESICEPPENLVALLSRKDRPEKNGAPLEPASLPYAHVARDGELAMVRTAEPGSRNTTLNKAAFSLGQLSPPLEPETTMQALIGAGMDTGLSEREATKTALSGFEAGQQSPRQCPAGTPTSAGSSSVILTRMSDVEREDVEFLWEPYLPKGKLVLFEGDPGCFKTFGALDVAARITTGRAMPGADHGAEPANVIYMTAEDGLADTIRGRLDDAGADPARVYALEGLKTTDPKTGRQREVPITLQNVAELREAMRRVRPAMVVVDPLQAYLGSDMDYYRANEVRPVLAECAKLAQEFGCVFVLIRHITKSAKDKAIHRGMGSIDFSAAARSVVLFGADPADETARVMAHVKSSLAAFGQSRLFTMEDLGRRRVRLRWEGTTPLRAADLLGPERRTRATPKLDRAKALLTQGLASGPRPTSVVLDIAEGLGISERTLKRAQRELEVVSERVGSVGQEGSWQLRLPDFEPPRHMDMADGSLSEALPKDANKPIRGEAK